MTYILMVNPSAVINSAGYANVGNTFTPGGRVVQSFNVGLLSIASFLTERGYDVRIVDLLNEPNTSKLEEELRRSGKPDLALISCISGFSYPSTLESARIIRENFPETPIGAGGCHVGGLGERVFEDTKNIDFVGLSAGEYIAAEAMRRIRAGESLAGMDNTYVKQEDQIVPGAYKPTPTNINNLPITRWDLYPEPGRFIPYVEESRGCAPPGGDCGFCMSSFQYGLMTSVMTPITFEKQVQGALDFFGDGKMYAIVASAFGLREKLAQQHVEILGEAGVKWTTEIRVDSPWESWLEQAAQSGLGVLNASPESGSPAQLQLMQKTQNPIPYLQKADGLIRRAAELDPMILKLNFIWYAGETPTTVDETLKFMYGLQPFIRSVSVAPLMLYPGTQIERELERYRKEFGTEIVDDSFWRSLRVHPVHVSKHFSFLEMAALGVVLDKIFNRNPADFSRTMDYKYGGDGGSILSIEEDKFSGLKT